ncbi:hypothetical protein ACSALU_000352 [Salmonella enterica subsp. enterica]
MSNSTVENTDTIRAKWGMVPQSTSDTDTSLSLRELIQKLKKNVIALGKSLAIRKAKCSFTRKKIRNITLQKFITRLTRVMPRKNKTARSHCRTTASLKKSPPGSSDGSDPDPDCSPKSSYPHCIKYIHAILVSLIIIFYSISIIEVEK